MDLLPLRNKRNNLVSLGCVIDGTGGQRRGGEFQMLCGKYRPARDWERDWMLRWEGAVGREDPEVRLDHGETKGETKGILLCHTTFSGNCQTRPEVQGRASEVERQAQRLSVFVRALSLVELCCGVLA